MRDAGLSNLLKQGRESHVACLVYPILSLQHGCVDMCRIGAGEYITRAALARTIGEAFDLRISEGVDLDPHEVLQRIITDKFWRELYGGYLDLGFTGLCSGTSKQRGISEPDVGVLLLTSEFDDEGNCRG